MTQQIDKVWCRAHCTPATRAVRGFPGFPCHDNKIRHMLRPPTLPPSHGKEQSHGPLATEGNLDELAFIRLGGLIDILRSPYVPR